MQQSNQAGFHMGIDNVIDYILSKPAFYPGKQNSATERTVGHQQPVEPKHQVGIHYKSYLNIGSICVDSTNISSSQ